MDLHQSEEAQYKLDGLILVIGVGRTKSDGHSVLQALGVISFDDESATYRIRAFNDGRFLESEVELVDQEKAINWGFALGQITTKSVLRINESGEWTELARNQDWLGTCENNIGTYGLAGGLSTFPTKVSINAAVTGNVKHSESTYWSAE